MRRKKLKKQQIYCGQDFRDWEGYRILQVQSDDLDRNVRIKLINETGHIVKLFLDDLCFDGETMSYTEWQGAPHSTTRKKTALCSETVKNSITILHPIRPISKLWIAGISFHALIYSITNISI